MSDRRQQDLEYGGGGILGVLTPSGNPTVEPEMQRLLAPDITMLTARMHSSDPSLLRRLEIYAETLDATLDSFGGIALDAVLFACTGSSYLLGPASEDALVARQKARGVRLLTAAQAIRTAAAEAGVRRVVLVNPYPPELREKAVAYWQDVGFDLADVVEVRNPKPGYHAIYTLRGEAVSAALARAAAIPADMVLLMGTGMASLPSLRQLVNSSASGNKLIVSSNLALAWAGRRALNPETGGPHKLLR
ncbi:hypothetical protein [Niveispirillum sp.]|uniref:aspartate racemase/maleate isomerase family protein n=1 Tax=Niveispirillum sp. TaxID=1917217 RepID=UPI001B59D4BF|nr:hypothetical protein [Niveispirillum sp.]MBP7335595.1 hypothetical protein [Niveispirillum sp.]